MLPPRRFPDASPKITRISHFSIHGYWRRAKHYLPNVRYGIHGIPITNSEFRGAMWEGAMSTNRKLAEQFAQFLFDAILTAGGERSTAHQCAAVWWRAIESGEFGKEKA